MHLDLETTNFHGRVGAILCWYLDQDNEPYEITNEDAEPDEMLTKTQLKRLQAKVNREADQEQRRIGRIVGLIPELCRGEFQKIDDVDLWDVWDALGTYYDRDDFLENLFESCRAELDRRGI